jgi:4-amino-4-deoxy-L-arabinose transferase-like glycosyltransferase
VNLERQDRQDRLTLPAGSNSVAVIFIWACFLARGIFYCAALPLWEGFDEYAHFAYVQKIAAGHGWFVLPETRGNREIELSISLVPMPWVLRLDLPAHETYESYWRLPVEERRSREHRLAALPRSLATQDSVNSLPVESQQPPLSYWLMAPVYAMLAGLTLPARVLALRLVNLLLASAVVPAAWMAARLVFRASGMALATAAVVALMPEVMFDAARVANSGLAIALYSVLAVLLLRVADGRKGAAPGAGVAMGLGLLTKAFFLTAVPALILVLVWAVWKRRTGLLSAAGGLGLAAAISAWWYVRNIAVTGSLSGLIQDAALRHVPLGERLRHASEVNWWSALDSTFFSHIWFGGWSFLQLRAWIYHFFALVALLAILGLAVAWVRKVPARAQLSVLAALYVLFCVGLAYHVLMTFLTNGISSSAGWYLCAVVVPETVLAAAGLRALAPALIRPYVVGALAGAFALLDLYGMLFVAIPYYTGLLSHKPSGLLEAFHWTPLLHAGVAEVLGRIGTNKPVWVGAWEVAVMGVIYLAATLILAYIALVAERRQK